MVHVISFHFIVSQIKASLAILDFCIDMGGFFLLVKLGMGIFKPSYFKFTETKP